MVVPLWDKFDPPCNLAKRIDGASPRKSLCLEFPTGAQDEFMGSSGSQFLIFNHVMTPRLRHLKIAFTQNDSHFLADCWNFTGLESLASLSVGWRRVKQFSWWKQGHQFPFCWAVEHNFCNISTRFVYTRAPICRRTAANFSKKAKRSTMMADITQALSTWHHGYCAGSTLYRLKKGVISIDGWGKHTDAPGSVTWILKKARRSTIRADCWFLKGLNTWDHGNRSVLFVNGWMSFLKYQKTKAAVPISIVVGQREIIF